MTAEIISIGDEVLSGHTVNTNAAFTGEALFLAGWKVQRVSVVGDREEEIQYALDAAFNRSSVVITSGGLGPTKDDLTKKAIANYFHVPLVFHSSILDDIEKRFKRMGAKAPQSNRFQAEIPENAEILINPAGTAPGLYIRKNDQHLFVTPGVPREMRVMMTEQVIPRIESIFGKRIVFQKSLLTTGISESLLADRLEGFEETYPDIQLAYLPELQGVKLRLILFSQNQPQEKEIFDSAIRFIKIKTGEAIFGEDDTTLPGVIAGLCIEKKLTLAIAESCTGGLISHKLTSIPGSSAYFERGVITYSNQAKMELLNVPEEIIRNFGAVSKETAEAMARGVRVLSKTDIGLSITGISGPDGGTPAKPVGLMYIGYSDSGKTSVEKLQLPFDRQVNNERAAYIALNLLRRNILGMV